MVLFLKRPLLFLLGAWIVCFEIRPYSDGLGPISSPMIVLVHVDTVSANRPVSQMRVPLTACRQPAGSYDKPTRLLGVLYVFEHKTQYILIHDPYTRIVVFWHISNIPSWIS